MMRYLLIAMAALGLRACTPTGAETAPEIVKVAPPAPTQIPAPPPPALPDTAGFALLRSLLTDHFDGGQAREVTTCATIGGKGNAEPLADDLEAGLMAEFPELAPLDRCVWREGRYVDAITGGNARVYQVKNLTCSSADRCVAMGGWVTANLGAEFMEYRIERSGGAWRITPTGVGVVS